MVCTERNYLSYRSCEQLIDAGGRINNQDVDDCTPLHYAAVTGALEKVGLLVLTDHHSVLGAKDKANDIAQDYAKSNSPINTFLSQAIEFKRNHAILFKAFKEKVENIFYEHFGTLFG